MRLSFKAALIGPVIAICSSSANADLNSQGILDQVITRFADHATAWQGVVMNAALFLFWTLGAISLVFTFGFMALKKADISEFFAEFIRFILFFGFFLWLLRNGPVFANSIISSLTIIGERASNLPSISPSGIVDVGFLIWKQAILSLSIWQPVDSFIGVFLSGAIMLMLAIIAVNMLLLLVSAWLLSYAGIFFLGFGGSRWTSDMAINYYKTVLGIGVQIMVMVLLLGVGNDLLSSFYAKMNTGTLNFQELGVMLVFCLALVMLVNRVPPLVAGIITGASIGGGGIGNFGVGAAIGAAVSAATLAAGAAGVAGAAVLSGAASAAGGASALQAAYSKASAATSEGGSGGGSTRSAGDGSSGSAASTSAAGGGSSNSSVFASATGGGKTDSLNEGGSGSGGGFGGGSSDADTTPGSGGISAGGGTGLATGGGASQDAQGGATSVNPKGPERGQGFAPGEQRTNGSRLGRAAAIAAGTASNLAQGSWDVAKAKAANLHESAVERISETTGGKIAAAIRAEAAPAFEGNELSGGSKSGQPFADEIAAFVNRESRSA